MSRLLIVDDEANNLKAYQRIFADTGYEILLVSSGEEALRQAVDFKPDIVLLDIMMPGMDGYKVCHQLKSNEQTKEAEIIFISAKRTLPDRLKGYDLKASDFIVKPFSPEELLAKVAVTMERIRFFRRLATVDVLTKLPNRKFFNAEFDTIYQIACRYGRTFSLAIIDIDHFKSVNDNYGHYIGDYALEEISGRIKGNVRSTDVLARIGGEEFSILMPETEKTKAVSVLERLRKGIASGAFVTPGHKHLLKITISVGVASFPDDARDEENLFKQADKALYLAKRRGRNRVEVAGSG